MLVSLFPSFSALLILLPGFQNPADTFPRAWSATRAGQSPLPATSSLTGFDQGQLKGKGLPRSWLEIGWDGSAPLAPSFWFLHLRDGSRLPGTPVGGGEDRISWALPCGVEIDVDLNEVEGVMRGKSHPFLTGGTEDCLVLGGEKDGPGDPRSGWCLAMGRDGLTFEGSGGESRHPWAQVSSIHLAGIGSGKREKGFWVFLRGGGFFRTTTLHGGSGGLEIQPGFAHPFLLPTGAVGRVAWRGGDVQELSSGWSPSVIFPQGTVDWSPRRGRSVEGRILSVSGTEAALGWGTQAPTSLTFDHAGPGVFMARVGLDDEVSGFRKAGKARFEVFLDGRLVAQSPEMGVGDPPFLLFCPLPRKGKLSLKTLALDLIPSGTHADWMDPVVWLALPVVG